MLALKLQSMSMSSLEGINLKTLKQHLLYISDFDNGFPVFSN